MKIFIIGMHRSGTSMITGILHKCGLELGSNLLMTARDNPKGHFEDRQFIRINNEILFRNGGSWHLPPKEIKIQADLKNRIREFIKQWDPQKITGFKDPRVCLTLPFWYQAINPEPIKAVIVVRPFSAIAKSLKRRNEMPIGKGTRLADHYIKSAFFTINQLKIPRIITIYHRYFRTYKKQVGEEIRIIRDWRRELEPVLKFTGLKLPKDPSIIDEFIDERLWHFRK